jgi:hypothetical protein
MHAQLHMLVAYIWEHNASLPNKPVNKHAMCIVCQPSSIMAWGRGRRRTVPASDCFNFMSQCLPTLCEPMQPVVTGAWRECPQHTHPVLLR